MISMISMTSVRHHLPVQSLQNVRPALPTSVQFGLKTAKELREELESLLPKAISSLRDAMEYSEDSKHYRQRVPAADVVLKNYIRLLSEDEKRRVAFGDPKMTT